MVALDLQLPIDSRSPAQARHALDGMNQIPPEVIDRFQLAVSELVTNVIRHAGLSATGDDAVHVVIRMSEDRLHVEVANPGRPFPAVAQRPGPGEEGGRGLYLVERSADRWGIKRNHGVLLWFEIDLPRTA